MKVHFDINDLSFTFVEENNGNKHEEKKWVLEEDNKIIIIEHPDSDDDFEIIGFNLKSKAFSALDTDISLNKEQFLTLFKSALLEEMSITSEESFSGIESTDESEKIEEPKDLKDSYSKSIKYDPEKIRLDPKQFSIREVMTMMDDNEIDLSPDFQRFFVWKEIKKQSSLIESILLKIPLPVFYLAQNKNSYYQVIDGVQRFTVIHRFINNKFRLKNLEYFDKCEKLLFKELDKVYQERIKRTMLYFNVLDPETPAQVKYDIFKRLNQGGKPLKGQEIRNSVSSRETRNLVKSLADSKEFKIATLGDINPIRMQDQELVLRFIAFFDDFDFKKKDFKTYTGDMEEFLTSKIDKLNEMNLKNEEYTKFFQEGMNNSIHLFGRYAFRKITQEYLKSKEKRKVLINKSLFTAWSIVLSKYSNAKVKKKPPESMVQILADKLKESNEYNIAVTQGTNQRERLKTSISTAYALAEEFL